MSAYDIIKRGFVLALLFACVILVWQVIAAVHTFNTTVLPSLHQGLTSLNQSAVNIRSITEEAHEYITLQLSLLRSSREQKAIQAGLEAAAAAKGTILLVNKVVIPRVLTELDSLNQATQSLNTMVENTDLQVNSLLLPQATATIKQAESSLQAVQVETQTIGGDIHTLVAGEDLKTALNSLTGASHELDLSMIHVEEAMQKMPTIAGHIETITGNSSKVSKIASIGSIGLIIAKIAALVF